MSPILQMHFTGKKTPFMQMKAPLVGKGYSVIALSYSFVPVIENH